jgi:hypothetical protein
MHNRITYIPLSSVKIYLDESHTKSGVVILEVIIRTHLLLLHELIK